MKIALDFQPLIDFFNSNSFTGFITILAALTAYIVYVNQKNDEKKMAARTVVDDIKNCLKQIEKIKLLLSRGDFEYFDKLPTIYISGNWFKYNHLFTKDLSEEALNNLSSFFINTHDIIQLVERQKDYFWKETDYVISNLLQKIYQEYKIDIESNGKIKSNKDQFDLIKQIIHNDLGISPPRTQYKPNKIIIRMEEILTDMENITSTYGYQKLRSLAQLPK